MKRTLIAVSRTHIIWQESESGMPEQALYIRRGKGEGSMFIQQGDHYIDLNIETIPLLCSLLKSMAADK